MKSILPNSRISMAPINFDTSNNSTNTKIDPDSVSVKIKKKPPIAPKKFFKEILANCNNDTSEGTKHRSSKNADAVVPNRITSKVYKFENLAQQQQQEKLAASTLCPKVFKSDSITMNTPAIDVLGKMPPADLKQYAKNLPQSHINYAESHAANNKVNLIKSNNLLDNYNCNHRNPSICNNSCNSSNIHRKFNSFDKNHLNSIQNSLTLQSNDKHDDKENSKKPDIEKANLEEVLYLCAEYEKQNQSQNQNKHTPNRIITNGSLPRDQRTSPLPKHESPTSLDKREQRSNNCSTFYENFATGLNNNLSSYIKYEPIDIQNNYRQSNNSTGSFTPSPRTLIKTFLTPTSTTTTNDSTAERKPLNNLELFEKMFPAENGAVSKKSSMEFDQEIIKQLKNKRAAVIKEINKFRHIVSDLKVQQDDIIGGMEFEKALLVGEYQSNLKELKNDHILRDKLIEKSNEIEKHAADRQRLQLQHQEEYKKTIDRIETGIKRLKAELNNIPNTSPNYAILLEDLKLSHEQLDNEKKNFEDLEFHHLEEEADCLATREELQRNLNEVKSRLEHKKFQIANIEKEKDDIIVTIQNDLRSTNENLREILTKIVDLEDELKFIDGQLKCVSGEYDYLDLSSDDDNGNVSEKLFRSFNDIDKRSTPKHNTMTQSFNDNLLRPSNGDDSTMSKCPSQDDIDRISKITSNAPIDDGHGSIGKETVKEIERFRQLHLVEKGYQVIEEERQRLTALKKRAQNEVKAEWAQNHSTDCIFMDENFKNSKYDNFLDQSNTFASKNEAELPDTSRPLSQSSEMSFDTTTVSSGDMSEVRLRNKPKLLAQQRPLTRFLPIRNSDLNLYQHIESAGHQIETCPQVKIDVFSCRGYLHKMGSRFHTWHKRWFVFDRKKRTFLYFLDKTEKKMRGGTYFQAIEEVYLDHLNSFKSPNPQLVFIVKTHQRSFYLMAPTSEALRIWVDVIITGAEGYQEYDTGS